MSRSRQSRLPSVRSSPDNGADTGQASTAPAELRAAGTTQASAVQAAPPLDDPTPIGVGIDTSRYGHHASFLRADLQPAAADLDFTESGPGYQELRRRLDAIAKQFSSVHFHFRLDVAGRYADNLLAFLHTLPEPKTISAGDPQRNKNYRAAIYGHKKSDPVESLAAARYALTERPRPQPVVTPQVRLLCHIASQLDSQTRQVTRCVNQLHNLLARAFPELALLVKDLSTGWILELLDRYPTAARLATARAASLEKIPYLPRQRIPRLLEQARLSVASLTGPIAEQLVRDQVRQLKQAHMRHKSLERQLVDAYHQLPEPNHLHTIPGFGEATAAVLTAKMVTSDRFVEPGKLVGYFGVFPIEAASGIDREGKPRATKRMVMCKRGNDLVRRYLYMAALSAIQCNPAVRPLYLRVLAKHPDKAAVAVGHAMRKLLHLALAVWKTGQPFNPEHYHWGQAAQRAPKENKATAAASGATPACATTEQSPQAAGHKVPPIKTERSVVTAARGTAKVNDLPVTGNSPLPASDQPASPIPHLPPLPANTAQPAPLWIDFNHLKTQLSLERLLEHLNLLADLRGRGSQRRGPCPVHARNGQRKGRTFSVHLEHNLFQCFDPKCAIKGDVIDLWAALKGVNLRDAAVQLVQVFALQPAPSPGTEKRHG